MNEEIMVSEVMESVETEDVMNIPDGVEFSEEERSLIESYAGKVDFSDTNSIVNFGSDAQDKLAEFSDVALNKVRTKDLGAVGESLSGLVSELKGFSALEEKKGLARLFSRAVNPIEQLKSKYTKASGNVEKVVDILDGHQVSLTKDVAVLDEMFKANTENFKSLSMYIVAGKQKLDEARNVTLPEMKKKAEETGNADDIQAVSDFSQMITRFEKKVHDLNLTRTVSLQMAPQIRMIQNNDTLMIEKIQTALVNTIPLWKGQMVLALGLANSEEALKAQRAVSDATNELLKKNAEVLRQTTVGIAEESERGVVDIETLQETNAQLIATIDDVMRIQKEGHEKRMLAETELLRLEGELKTKVLEAIS